MLGYVGKQEPAKNKDLGSFKPAIFLRDSPYLITQVDTIETKKHGSFEKRSVTFEPKNTEELSHFFEAAKDEYQECGLS